MIQVTLAPQHGNRIRHGRGPESLLKRYFQFDTDDFFRDAVSCR